MQSQSCDSCVALSDLAWPICAAWDGFKFQPVSERASLDRCQAWLLDLDYTVVWESQVWNNQVFKLRTNKGHSHHWTTAHLSGLALIIGHWHGYFALLDTVLGHGSMIVPDDALLDQASGRLDMRPPLIAVIITSIPELTLGRNIE